jgi:hypothetical protein
VKKKYGTWKIDYGSKGSCCPLGSARSQIEKGIHKSKKIYKNKKGTKKLKKVIFFRVSAMEGKKHTRKEYTRKDFSDSKGSPIFTV